MLTVPSIYSAYNHLNGTPMNSIPSAMAPTVTILSLTRLSIDGDKNRKPQIEIKTFKPSVKPSESTILLIMKVIYILMPLACI